MATGYLLKCEKCKYEVDAIYGGYRDSINENMKLTKKFLDNKGNEDFQRVYNAFKYFVTEEENEYWKNIGKKDIELVERPWVLLQSQLYECENCKIMFNHDMVRIVCDKAEFFEKMVCCPECHKDETFQVDEEELELDRSKSNENIQISKLTCPKCNNNFRIMNYSIMD